MQKLEGRTWVSVSLDSMFNLERGKEKRSEERRVGKEC